MTRVKFYRHNKDTGAVERSVIIVSNKGGYVEGRIVSVAEAERVMVKDGWTRKKLKPLTAKELSA